MNIGMVLWSNFPPDIRVEKEAAILLDAGHKITVITNQASHGQPAEEVLENGLKIFRFPHRKGLIGTTLRAWSALTQINLDQAQHIAGITSKLGLEVLHCHDLHTVASGLVAAKKNNIPLIADLHENYPAGISLWFQHGGSHFFARRIHTYRRWVRHEKKVLQKVQKIIVVVDEAKTRLVERYGLPESKIAVVGNTEPCSFRDGGDMFVWPDELKRRCVLLYIGGYGVHRGLETCIKGMGNLKHRPEIKLLLVGKGTRLYEEKLHSLVRDCKVEDSVVFLGWQPSSKVASIQSQSDICLIPHSDTEHTQTTIPHKLFQAMVLGKPVLVSSCKPLARVVERAKCGVVFKADDPSEFAEKVQFMFGSLPMLKKWGELGAKAVTGDGAFAHKHTARALIKLYRDIVNE